jgi:hypothetical protein
MDGGNDIASNVAGLSIGGAAVFDKFLYIAGDFIKQGRARRGQVDNYDFGNNGNASQAMGGGSGKSKLTPEVSCSQM